MRGFTLKSGVIVTFQTSLQIKGELKYGV